jgi:hypothetical protein
LAYLYETPDDGAMEVDLGTTTFGLGLGDS